MLFFFFLGQAFVQQKARISDEKPCHVARINFRSKQLKMVSRKTIPLITVYLVKTSAFNQEAVMH